MIVIRKIGKALVSGKYRREKVLRLTEKAVRIVNPYFSIPMNLSFTLTNRCNLNCGFCPKTTFGVQEKETRLEVLNAVVNLARGMGMVQILGLGEPLVSQYFLKTLERLKGSDVYVSVTTNGLLLNESIGEQLCRLGADEIIFSVEGASKETHQLVKDSKLDELITNIKRIGSIKQDLETKSPGLSFNFAGMTNNIGELPGIIELADEVGVEHVYLGNVMPLDENTWSYHLHRDPEKACACIEKGKKIARKLGITLKVYASLSPYPTPCSWYNRPHIGLDGDVYPCNFIGAQDSLKSLQTIWYEGLFLKIDVSEYKLGNILEEKLERIWNNQKIRGLRKIFCESVKKDRKLDWSPEAYKNLLLKYQDRELSPEEFCRICPHRFRITH